MKPYPRSTSDLARPVSFTVYFGRESITGKTALSLAQPRRALRRLLAWLERENPTATYITAEFDEIQGGILYVEGTDTEYATTRNAA